MRVTSAVSRSAENEDEREGQLKRMWISASASSAAENEEKSVHPKLEYRLGLPIYRLLYSAFRLSKSSWCSDLQMDKICGHCSDKKQKDEPQRMCCNNVDVWLWLLGTPSGGFLSYMTATTAESRHYLQNIGRNNSCFQMTSFGATSIIQESGFLHTFKVQGRI